MEVLICNWKGYSSDTIYHHMKIRVQLHQYFESQISVVTQDCGPTPLQKYLFVRYRLMDLESSLYLTVRFERRGLLNSHMCGA